MGEEVKKSRPAPDPNSAKFKLGQIAAKAYSDAIEAKARGEMVGWCASNFPVEIPETLGLYVCYPENQAAAIAARGGGERMCNISEGEGYSNDICAYARTSLAYMKVKDAPEQNMPLPDFVLCCNNICNCMIKWYENIAKELDIPMIMIDIPFNPDKEGDHSLANYINNLKKIRNLPVTHVFPAHRGEISCLSERVDEILEHHRERLDEITGVLSAKPMCAFEAAGKMTWYYKEGNFQNYPLVMKWMATSEILAHLQYLWEQGEVSRFGGPGETYIYRYGS